MKKILKKIEFAPPPNLLYLLNDARNKKKLTNERYCFKLMDIY